MVSAHLSRAQNRFLRAVSFTINVCMILIMNTKNLVWGLNHGGADMFFTFPEFCLWWRLRFQPVGRKTCTQIWSRIKLRTLWRRVWHLTWGHQVSSVKKWRNLKFNLTHHGMKKILESKLRVSVSPEQSILYWTLWTLALASIFELVSSEDIKYVVLSVYESFSHIPIFGPLIMFSSLFWFFLCQYLSQQ
jgi:hypothetical protein